MKILNVTIKDWGPFKGEHVFKFPDEPGLYFLWGRNEAEPRLGANGAGKTRLFEAICWCIFGKTSKGLKAGDVANWDQGKGASVSIFAEVDGALSSALITRRWSPNSWTAEDLFGNVTDLTKDETNPVLASLRMSFDSFLNAGLILKSQSRPMFLDLKPEKKAELFSEVMGLDRWLDMAQKASKKATAEDEECRGIEQSLARIEGSIEQLEKVDDTGTDWAVWELERETRLKEVHADYDRALQRYDGIKKALNEVKEAKGPDLGAIEQTFTRAQDDVLLCQEALNDIEAEVWLAMKKVEELQKHSAMLEELDEAECPTCGQLITGKHLATERQRMLKQLDILEEEAQSLDKRAGVTRNELNGARRICDEIAAELEAGEFEARRRGRVVEDLRHDLTRANQKLDQLEEESAQLKEKTNPHKARQQEREDRLTKLKDQRRQLQRQLDDKLSRWKLFTHWAKWFKEIRLEQIGEALTQLEIEVNSQVVALGLTDWSISFAVDRETASGSVQRGFSVSVTSPQNTKPVPWEAWSGGESQRLRIAAQCGLSNLIRSQTGSEFNLECWDEPTDALSEQGIKDLLVALAERAEIEQRQIWVIDHHSLSFGGFAGSAGVIKTKDGSRFDLSALYV